MNSNHLQSRIGRAILSVSLLLGVGFAASATALAQDEYGRNRQDRSDRQDRRDRERGRRGDRDNDRRYPFSQRQ